MDSTSHPISKRIISYDCDQPWFISVVPYHGLNIGKFEISDVKGVKTLKSSQDLCATLHYGTCIKRFIDFLLNTICERQQEDFHSVCQKVKILQLRPPQKEFWGLEIQVTFSEKGTKIQG